jgi:hypothetical protein
MSLSNSQRQPQEPFWFQLVDSDGEPYQRTMASKVSFTVTPDVADFQDAVKAKNSDSHLKGISPSDLQVYKNKAAFDQRKAVGGQEVPLDPTLPLGGLGNSKDMLIVVITPSPSGMCPRSLCTARKPVSLCLCVSRRLCPIWRALSVSSSNRPYENFHRAPQDVPY